VTGFEEAGDLKGPQGIRLKPRASAGRGLSFGRRDYGAAEIQRIAENAPCWPDMNLAAEYESEAPC
jgi:hypothetical protein